MGLAMIMYGREEGAETLIEQMSRDQDPILRRVTCFSLISISLCILPCFVRSGGGLLALMSCRAGLSRAHRAQFRAALPGMEVGTSGTLAVHLIWCSSEPFAKAHHSFDSPGKGQTGAHRLMKKVRQRRSLTPFFKLVHA